MEFQKKKKSRTKVERAINMVSLGKAGEQKFCEDYDIRICGKSKLQRFLESAMLVTFLLLIFSSNYL